MKTLKTLKSREKQDKKAKEQNLIAWLECKDKDSRDEYLKKHPKVSEKVKDYSFLPF